MSRSPPRSAPLPLTPLPSALLPPCSHPLLSHPQLAPMSTTNDLKIAVKYTRPQQKGTALIFMLRVDSFMSLGADLTHLSAFPHEQVAILGTQVAILGTQVAILGTQVAILGTRDEEPPPRSPDAHPMHTRCAPDAYQCMHAMHAGYHVRSLRPPTAHTLPLPSPRYRSSSIPR